MNTNYNNCDPCATNNVKICEPPTTSDIKYVGGVDVCTTVENNSTLTTVLLKIISFIKNRLFSVISSSLVVSNVPNNCNKYQRIELVPSSDPGNTLIIGTDGKPYSSGGSSVILNNGQCISFTATVVDNVTVYTPVLDIACIAAQVCTLCSPTTCTSPLNLTVTNG